MVELGQNMTHYVSYIANHILIWCAEAINGTIAILKEDITKAMLVMFGFSLNGGLMIVYDHKYITRI